MKRAFFLFFAFLGFKALAATYYVDINNPNPVPPYTSWDTAATNIQDAVDVSTDGDLVLVNDGVYQNCGQVVDGSLTNRVAISKAITVQSVNGPAVTVIQGYQDTNTINGDDAVRCVYLSDGAVLSGFTLTNGATQIDPDESWDYTLYTGGGVFCDSTDVVVTNCIITGCSASDAGGGAEGGNTFIGIGGGTFLNCAFIGNQCVASAGADQCTLSNCTLTGNSSAYGGGAGISTLINCTLANNSATNGGSGAGGGVFSCTLVGCILETNFSDEGGGTFGNSDNPCTLSNCTLIGNSTSTGGGGANGSTLMNCTLTGNLAVISGGGAQYSTLTNCTLTANSADGSGGADSSVLNNCTLTSNSAVNGGGAGNSTLNNCALTENSAESNGGASENNILNNCTLLFNSAASMGGGADSSTLNNCIVYFNSAPCGTNFSQSTLNYCCTTPLPCNGMNNITGDPQLADVTYLSAGSPCIGAGSTNYSTGVGLDGQPWLTPPSIGCDEYYAGMANGPLTVAIQAGYTNVLPAFATTIAGLIYGQASGIFWNFGDGTTASNQLLVSHNWAAAGTYPVVLTAYNDSNPGGISATAMVSVTTQQIYFVNAGSPNPAAPFATWSTAAADIQDAVEAAVPGGIVLVTNGVYATGGQVIYGLLTNRVVINKPVTVQSVSGPGPTVIEGYQDTNTVVADDAVRCVFLANNAVLSGFTLANGATRDAGDDNLEQCGGGVWCPTTNAIITNCVFVANAANNSGGGANQATLNQCIFIGNVAGSDGGGVNDCWLNHCVLTNNQSGTLSVPALKTSVRQNVKPLYVISSVGGGAENSTLNSCLVADNSSQGGGGADSSILNNCLLIGNSALFGGGAQSSTLNNCTLIANDAGIIGGGVYGSTMNNCIDYYNSGGDAYGTYNYCCTDQQPGGIGNITNAPCFDNWTNNDFHLRGNSPCINSGDNLYVATTSDLDGNPRIVGRTVDMGAYEYQTPTSVLSYAWAQQYGLPTDGSVDYADLDGTGMNDWQKWLAGLNPTNSASVLVMLIPTNSACGITVSWESVSNRAYFLQRSCTIMARQPFSTIQSNITGQAGITAYMDNTTTNSTPYFYRVGVQ